MKLAEAVATRPNARSPRKARRKQGNGLEAVGPFVDAADRSDIAFPDPGAIGHEDENELRRLRRLRESGAVPETRHGESEDVGLGRRDGRRDT